MTLIKFKKLRIIALIFFITPLYAGPPFLTNDPDVTPYKETDFYFYSQSFKNADGSLIEAPSLEMDWGFAQNWELAVFVPYDIWFAPTDDQSNSSGLGDTYLQVEYRFVQESTYLPAIAIQPQISIPTGNASRNLGYGTPTYQIPIWMEKSFGSWVIDTGGGYNFNSSSNSNNNGFAGFLVQKNFNTKLTLGAEIFYQGATGPSEGSGAYTLLNVGATYNFTPRFSFLCSVGNSIAGEENFITYVGFLWDTGGD